MGNRRRGRQRAVQVLYEWELTGRSIDVVLEMFWRARQEPDEVREFAESLARGTADRAEHIDALIDHQSANWRLDRLSNVDRGILRLGVYELLNDSDTPPAVVIDEAIELGKRFSGEGSGRFVNGILDGIRKRLESADESTDMEGTTAEAEAEAEES